MFDFMLDCFCYHMYALLKNTDNSVLRNSLMNVFVVVEFPSLQIQESRYDGTDVQFVFFPNAGERLCAAQIFLLM